MIWMLWCQIYLCGALVTLVGASIAAYRLSEPDVPAAARAGAIVIAGVSWPVLLVGLLQLLCVAGLAKAVRSTRVSPVQSYFEPQLQMSGDQPAKVLCERRPDN
jgi:hypothetical protein